MDPATVNNILAECDARNLHMMLFRVQTNHPQQPWRATIARTGADGIKVEVTCDSASYIDALQRAWIAFPHAVVDAVSPATSDDDETHF